MSAISLTTPLKICLHHDLVLWVHTKTDLFFAQLMTNLSGSIRRGLLLSEICCPSVFIIGSKAVAGKCNNPGLSHLKPLAKYYSSINRLLTPLFSFNFIHFSKVLNTAHVFISKHKPHLMFPPPLSINRVS